VIDATACVAPDWGIKVLSGSCKIIGVDPLSAIIETAIGNCQFSFVAKKGTVSNTFEVQANAAKMISYAIAELPSRSTFTVPQGIVWKEPDSKGNLKQFSIGAGVEMGDEGTGYVFDTLTKFPIVSFEDTDKTICFGRDSYANRMTEIDVGNGVGCLSAGYHVEINVETKTVTTPPWKDGADGGVDSGTDSGKADAAVGDGDAGTGTVDASPPPPGGGGDGGCNCSSAISSREGVPFSGSIAFALLIASRLVRRRARSVS
jgi:hypothetical protein